MRAVALAIVLALLLGGCMNRPPHRDRSGEVSYNRRDLPPEPGLFTGKDGVWTIYRNNPDGAPAGGRAGDAEEDDCEGPSADCDGPSAERH